MLARCVAILALMAVACQPAASTPSPQQTASPSPIDEGDTPSPPLASGSPDPTGTPTASRTPAAKPLPSDYEFVRWIAPEVELLDQPGGRVAHVVIDEPISPVMDRLVADGMEWIRVLARMEGDNRLIVSGWTPRAVDVQDGDRWLHFDPAYEAVEPECPDGPLTLQQLGGLIPGLALACFGAAPMSFSPVQVRRSSNYDDLMQGEPSWLVPGEGLTMHWFPDSQEWGSSAVFVDPEQGRILPVNEWLEVTGHLDHPKARDCSVSWMNLRSGDVAFAATREDATAICRSRFVVTDFRSLTSSEIPDYHQSIEEAGPMPEQTIEVGLRGLRAPFPNRVGAPGVWTGDEMLVWGGYALTRQGLQGPRSGGVAYSPASARWRDIPAGGPLEPRSGHLAAWTGQEMLVIGGTNRVSLSDGAAYDPQTDRWRRIAESPIRRPHEAAWVWTGEELWLSRANDAGLIETAAYDPGANEWRRLPDVSGSSGVGVGVAWTGDRVLLVHDQVIHSIASGGDSWSSSTVDFWPSSTFAGGLLFGHQNVNTSADPFEPDVLSYPVAWNPVTGTEIALPLPPFSPGGAIVADDYLIYWSKGLAFDIGRRTWLRLQIPSIDTYREGMATVWAGDRLLLWGGWAACPGLTVERDELGHELIPELPPAGIGSTIPSSRSADPDRHSIGSGRETNPYSGRYAC